jgi:pimeloyl-ACP methyl ester carboxylesterase
MTGRETAIVVCPGFFQSKDTPTFQRMSRALADDYDVLAMDFRGHGRSGGLYTFSACEWSDLEAVLSWGRSRYQRIGILAFSLGAAIAIHAIGRKRQQVESLVAVSTPCAFEEVEFKWWTKDAIRTGIHALEPGAGCRPGNLFLKKARPIEHVRHLSPTPVLFIHGTKDVIVGVGHSRRLHEAAREPKRLEIVEGGGHAEALFRDDHERFCKTVKGWYAQTLNPPPVSETQL